MTDKQDTFPVDDAPRAADEAPPARLSLEQFCIELSTNDKRVEMIGAFHHLERREGRTYDTSDAYAARYEAFTQASPK